MAKKSRWTIRNRQDVESLMEHLGGECRNREGDKQDWVFPWNEGNRAFTTIQSLNPYDVLFSVGKKPLDGNTIKVTVTYKDASMKRKKKVTPKKAAAKKVKRKRRAIKKAPIAQEA